MDAISEQRLLRLNRHHASSNCIHCQTLSWSITNRLQETQFEFHWQRIFTLDFFFFFFIIIVIITIIIIRIYRMAIDSSGSKLSCSDSNRLIRSLNRRGKSREGKASIQIIIWNNIQKQMLERVKKKRKRSSCSNQSRKVQVSGVVAFLIYS